MKKCIFCNNKDFEYIIINEHSFSIKDQYPVSDGHCLIIPKRHVQTIWELSDEELKDLYDTLLKTKQTLESNYNPDPNKPDGYNIGINQGEAAGQTVLHLHIHLIPRYEGDVVCPRGGVRGVIPSKQFY